MSKSGVKSHYLAPEAGWQAEGGRLEGLEATAEGLRLEARALPVSLEDALPASGAGFVTFGRLTAGPLDGGEAGTTWHRVELDAEAPPGTALLVETRTGELPQAPAEGGGPAWAPAVGAGAAATGAAGGGGGGGGWSAPQVNPVEFMPVNPPGRYLWLRLTLRGSGRMTPLVRAARVHYPRVTSLRFLPASFRADPEGRGFLERLMALVDREFDSLRERTAETVRLFDPAAAPAETLAWLAGILGVAADPFWPEATRRRYLARAGELFGRRGTVEGLRDALEPFLGRRPEILEHFRLREAGGAGGAGGAEGVGGSDLPSPLPSPAAAGEGAREEAGAVGGAGMPSPRPSPAAAGEGDGAGATGGMVLPYRVGVDPAREAWESCAHRFSVLLRAGECAGSAARAALTRVVEAEKPAHTVFDFREEAAGAGVEGSAAGGGPEAAGAGGRIGIDTVLGDGGLRL